MWPTASSSCTTWGGSVRKEYNKNDEPFDCQVNAQLQYKTAYNIGKCHMLTEEWIIDAWNHRDNVDFHINAEDFVSPYVHK